MAQYEAQCSAVGGFDYANNFKLYVVLTDGNVSGNLSKVNYNVYCQSSGSGSIDAKHLKYFNLNGKDIINSTEQVTVSSPNAYISIASGTTDWIEHDSDGSKTINFSAQIKGNTYGVSASLSGTFKLTQIPRYAKFTKFEAKSKTVNTITISWECDVAVNDCQYSLNGGEYNGSAISYPDYTIENLSPNTEYVIKLKTKRRDSGLWSESETITVTTYDIAKINNITDFEHGNNPTVSITNPGSISSLSLVMKVGDTQILSRIVSAGNNTITFSDTELDNLYKKYGSSNSLAASFILSGSGYTNTKTCTVTLKGNQKTIYMSAKRGKVFVGTKRGVTWRNVNGTWKRGG